MLEIDVSYSIYYLHQSMHIAFGIIHVVNGSLNSVSALYLHIIAHYFISQMHVCEFRFQRGIYISSFSIKDLVE